MNKIVIINRAVPGSGKTTISKSIVEYMLSKKIQTNIHSTDNFFLTKDNEYIFDITKLNEYHNKNQSDFSESLAKNTPLVICDNINILPWQTEPYTILARKYGYKIIFINFYPRELKKHIESQKITKEKPDAHGVSKDVLLRFIEEHRVYNSLLDKTIPINENTQIRYTWDAENSKRKSTGKLSKYFDLDYLVEIYPEEYHVFKNIIGKKIYDIHNIGNNNDY